MLRILAVLAAVLLLPSTCFADGAALSFGGDQYVAGEAAAIRSSTEHDVFMVGRQVDRAAAVSGSAHAGGFNVDIAAPVTGNVYAGGFNIDLSATVGGNVTAIGNNISVRPGSTIGGNARLAGATVNLSGAVAGSALITAQTLTLDAPIATDLNFSGEKLVFAPGAKVSGNVLIQAPKPIDVPTSVAPADHVKFVQIASSDYASQAGNAANTVTGSHWPAVQAGFIWWLLLLVVGVVLIAFAPKTVSAAEAASVVRPWRNFGYGIVTLAALFGLVPLAAMTVIGIVLLPFIFVLIALAWGLGYIAGIYLVGLRIGRAIMAVNSNGKRILVFAAALVVAILLGTIPMLGWLLGLVLMLYGLGTIAAMRLDRGNAQAGGSSATVVPAI